LKSDAKAREYASAFVNNDILSIKTLSIVDARELSGLGVSLGHRTIIQHNVNELLTGTKKRRSFQKFSGNFGFKLHGMGQEFCSCDLWKSAVAEFLGSAIFVFVVVGIIVGSGLLPKTAGEDLTFQSTPLVSSGTTTMRYLSVAIGAGFAFGLASWVFADISGGHITPAITFVHLWTQSVTPIRWLVYLAAQVAGAIIGTGFVNTVSFHHFDEAEGGQNVVQDGYGNGKTVGIEVLTTFILCMVALSLSERRPKHAKWFGHLILGFVFLVVHLISIPIDGTSMNPARSFGTSAVYQQWRFQWAFWLGPALGSIIAAVFYEILLREKPLNSEESDERSARKVRNESKTG